MQNNGDAVLIAQSLPKEATGLPQYNLLKEENSKLLMENENLKKTLTKEKFYHQNLYKQWNELNVSLVAKDRELKHLKSIQNPMLKVYQYAFYCLLLLTALLVVLNFYAIKSENRRSEKTQILIPEKKETASQKAASAEKQKALPVMSINTKPEASSRQVNDNPLSLKAAIDLVPVKNTLKYIIKQKSFFHNKPEVNTERNTFILPADDSYGILTALNEQNGFIYVIFKNHNGRISRGWISKSDLQPLQ